MAGIGDQVTGLEFLMANSFKTVRDLRLLAHLVSRRLVSGHFGVWGLLVRTTYTVS